MSRTVLFALFLRFVCFLLIRLTYKKLLRFACYSTFIRDSHPHLFRNVYLIFLPFNLGVYTSQNILANSQSTNKSKYSLLFVV